MGKRKISILRKFTWQRQPGKASNFSLPLHLWTEKPQPGLFRSPSSHFIQEWRFLCTLPLFHVCSRVRELLGLLSGFTIPPTICRCFSWIWLSYLTLNLWRNLKEILFLIHFFIFSRFRQLRQQILRGFEGSNSKSVIFPNQSWLILSFIIQFIKLIFLPLLFLYLIFGRYFWCPEIQLECPIFR